MDLQCTTVPDFKFQVTITRSDRGQHTRSTACILAVWASCVITPYSVLRGSYCRLRVSPTAPAPRPSALTCLSAPRRCADAGAGAECLWLQRETWIQSKSNLTGCGRTNRQSHRLKPPHLSARQTALAFDSDAFQWPLWRLASGIWHLASAPSSRRAEQRELSILRIAVLQPACIAPDAANFSPGRAPRRA